MKTLFIIVNTLLLMLFAFGQYYILKFSPEVKERLSIILGIVFASYLLLITMISIQAMWVRNFAVIPLIIFLFIPFLIGKKVSYETIPLWSNVQLGAFALSLIYCLFLV